MNKQVKIEEPEKQNSIIGLRVLSNKESHLGCSWGYVSNENIINDSVRYHVVFDNGKSKEFGVREVHTLAECAVLKKKSDPLGQCIGLAARIQQSRFQSLLVKLQNWERENINIEEHPQPLNLQNAVLKTTQGICQSSTGILHSEDMDGLTTPDQFTCNGDRESRLHTRNLKAKRSSCSSCRHLFNDSQLILCTLCEISLCFECCRKDSPGLEINSMGPNNKDFRCSMCESIIINSIEKLPDSNGSLPKLKQTFEENALLKAIGAIEHVQKQNLIQQNDQSEHKEAFQETVERKQQGKESDESKSRLVPNDEEMDEILFDDSEGEKAREGAIDGIIGLDKSKEETSQKEDETANDGQTVISKKEANSSINPSQIQCDQKKVAHLSASSLEEVVAALPPKISQVIDGFGVIGYLNVNLVDLGVLASLSVVPEQKSLELLDQVAKAGAIIGSDLNTRSQRGAQLLNTLMKAYLQLPETRPRQHDADPKHSPSRSSKHHDRQSKHSRISRDHYRDVDKRSRSGRHHNEPTSWRRRYDEYLPWEDDSHYHSHRGSPPYRNHINRREKRSMKNNPGNDGYYSLKRPRHQEFDATAVPTRDFHKKRVDTTNSSLDSQNTQQDAQLTAPPSERNLERIQSLLNVLEEKNIRPVFANSSKGPSPSNLELSDSDDEYISAFKVVDSFCKSHSVENFWRYDDVTGKYLVRQLPNGSLKTLPKQIIQRATIAVLNALKKVMHQSKMFHNRNVETLSSIVDKKDSVSQMVTNNSVDEELDANVVHKNHEISQNFLAGRDAQDDTQPPPPPPPPPYDDGSIGGYDGYENYKNQSMIVYEYLLETDKSHLMIEGIDGILYFADPSYPYFKIEGYSFLNPEVKLCFEIVNTRSNIYWKDRVLCDPTNFQNPPHYKECALEIYRYYQSQNKANRFMVCVNDTYYFRLHSELVNSVVRDEVLDQNLVKLAEFVGEFSIEFHLQSQTRGSELRFENLKLSAEHMNQLHGYFYLNKLADLLFETNGNYLLRKEARLTTDQWSDMPCYIREAYSVVRKSSEDYFVELNRLLELKQIETKESFQCDSKKLYEYCVRSITGGGDLFIEEGGLYYFKLIRPNRVAKISERDWELMIPAFRKIHQRVRGVSFFYHYMIQRRKQQPEWDSRHTQELFEKNPTHGNKSRDSHQEEVLLAAINSPKLCSENDKQEPDLNNQPLDSQKNKPSGIEQHQQELDPTSQPNKRGFYLGEDFYEDDTSSGDGQSVCSESHDIVKGDSDYEGSPSTMTNDIETSEDKGDSTGATFRRPLDSSERQQEVDILKCNYSFCSGRLNGYNHAMCDCPDFKEVTNAETKKYALADIIVSEEDSSKESRQESDSRSGLYEIGEAESECLERNTEPKQLNQSYVGLKCEYCLRKNHLIDVCRVFARDEKTKKLKPGWVSAGPAEKPSSHSPPEAVTVNSLLMKLRASCTGKTGDDLLKAVQTEISNWDKKVRARKGFISLLEADSRGTLIFPLRGNIDMPFRFDTNSQKKGLSYFLRRMEWSFWRYVIGRPPNHRPRCLRDIEDFDAIIRNFRQESLGSMLSGGKGTHKRKKQE